MRYLVTRAPEYMINGKLHYMWFVTDFAVWKIVTIARVLFLTVCQIQLYTDQVKLKHGPAVYACNPRMFCYTVISGPFLLHDWLSSGYISYCVVCRGEC